MWFRVIASKHVRLYTTVEFNGMFPFCLFTYQIFKNVYQRKVEKEIFLKK